MPLASGYPLEWPSTMEGESVIKPIFRLGKFRQPSTMMRSIASPSSTFVPDSLCLSKITRERKVVKRLKDFKTRGRILISSSRASQARFLGIQSFEVRRLLPFSMHSTPRRPQPITILQYVCIFRSILLTQLGESEQPLPVSRPRVQDLAVVIASAFRILSGQRVPASESKMHWATF